jgi:hypothetical protein
MKTLLKSLLIFVPQFLSILLSCLLFAHTLTLGQISGTAVVFCALFYRCASLPRVPHAPSPSSTSCSPRTSTLSLSH